MNQAISVAMIVAAAKNGVIGINNQMPWHLPEDLKYFRRVTMGKPVVMGRKTFESIGKPLPGRLNIVISRQKDVQLPEGVVLQSSVGDALAFAKQYALKQGLSEIMVIGGEQIYRACMPFAEVLYLTEVDAEPEGDAWFEYQPSEWQLQTAEQYLACDKNPYNYRFCEFKRL